MRGNPIPDDDQDGDHNEGISKRRFRLRRKKDGKRRKARRGRAKQGDIETGQVPQDADKSGGFGLSSKEQNTPADAVLAEEGANEVRSMLLHSCPYSRLTTCP